MPVRPEVRLVLSIYPSSTVFALLAGLLRHMRRIDAECPNLLDVEDPRFKEMHAVIDAYFRQLRECGIGAETKHTPLVSKEEENALWDEGVIGIETHESSRFLLQWQEFLPAWRK